MGLLKFAFDLRRINILLDTTPEHLAKQRDWLNYLSLKRTAEKLKMGRGINRPQKSIQNIYGQKK